MRNFISVIILLSCISNSSTTYSQRRVINLNGNWQITKTNLKSVIPTKFTSTIALPGLVDMAIPAIDTIPAFHNKKLDLTVEATNIASNSKLLDSIKSNNSWYYNNSVYWYKKNIQVNVKKNEQVLLKINKAMYHTKVYVNGKLAGENCYSFTPTLINIKPYLNRNKADNELIISVGCRNNLPDTVAKGDDFEKFFFIPGIYDDVKLIVTGKSYISNVQIAPDIQNQELRVLAETNSNNQSCNKNWLSYIVRETISGKIITTGKTSQTDFKIKIPDCKLWSPEQPFMYELELSTGTDNLVTRFGMRSVSTSANTGELILNGKPYFLRGTNVCLFRFFEDEDRDNLPWDSKWVIDLHKGFKLMHWNSYRPTLGFPPERWYEIADSLGFLVQDEYPVWKGHKAEPDGVTSTTLANEYREWLRERWNHSSVVIWDAQNESVYDTTAIAINKVRHLDLSNRPWDNGWAAPANNDDIMETHPYLLYSSYARLKEGKKVDFPNGLLNYLFKEEKNATGPNFSSNKLQRKHPIINNEYSWLWLNRDGTPTVLTDSIYTYLFPEANTAEKRLEVYARLLGMETEFWRSSRKFAGLMNFCALSYSRPKAPRGLTSDNFNDVKRLKFDPYFYQYVRDAFSPIGIMINFWDEKIVNGSELKIPVNIINDTYTEWNGALKLNLFNSGELINTQSQSIKVKALGKISVTIPLIKVERSGKYKLETEIMVGGESVRSVREFIVE
ncbi:MAG: glycoside hydrolase family 2 TIM barrel-domain containing protein [Paludibacter sp.]|nr:glycoside hydrolase family 2 TIM barrel-domain containing protein [Paludibacter sp.]